MNTFARRAKSQLRIYQSGNRKGDQDDQAKQESRRSSNAGVDGRSYGSGHWVGHWALATFNGNLYPIRLQPGTAYKTRKDDHTDNLKVIKAMLMLYNATIFTDTIGMIVLKNKDAYSTTIIDIEDKDVVSFIIKRGNQEKSQIEEIYILAGDTTQLQGIIKNRLIDFYDSKWSIEAVIDQLFKYDLSLQSRIRIQDKVYAITELERDFIKDKYKVNAWLLLKALSSSDGTLKGSSS